MNQDNIPNELRDGIFPLQEEDKIVYTTNGMHQKNWTNNKNEDNTLLRVTGYDWLPEPMRPIPFDPSPEQQAEWDKFFANYKNGKRQLWIPIYSENKIWNWVLVQKWKIVSTLGRIENWYLTGWMFLKYKLTGHV